MEQAQLNWITNFIWGIADDVLRDLYVRGKYRDVILPMIVIRRLDAVLELSRQVVLDMRALLDQAGIPHWDAALRQAARQVFYNTSKVTLCNAEQVPLLKDSGIKAFPCREVPPHVPDAWHVESSVKTSCEISSIRYSYQPKPMRNPEEIRDPEEIRADIWALKKEGEGLLNEIIGSSQRACSAGFHSECQGEEQSASGLEVMR